MMKKNLYTFLFLLLSTLAYGQKSPEEFLGYPLGERFTPHHRVVAYFEHVAANSPLVELQYYGESYEHRPLFVAVISSEANMGRLEQIREDNLKRTGFLSGSPETGLAINWMQYNVHGNEAVATEAAMMTFWDLVNPEDTRYKAWLENQVVLIDPCANPDGKDRYTIWYNQKQNKRLQPDPQSVEHSEPWPGGRPNHYLLDLNRDWAWQTQQETKQRLELYHQWMPHLFVDFHEQGINDPFYFAPAAKPVHKQVTGFQREFQEIYGKNTAEKFDAQGWLYFTKERFDLLYPAYGDTYPMYNGAIGMTIEKGGSGRAGLGMLNALKDTVTLKERIEHQHIAGISAVEVAAKEAQKLTDNFTAFFKDNRENPQGKYKSFILKVGDQPERLRGLLELLDLNKVHYGELGRKATFSGLDYQTGKVRSFTAEAKDIVVSADQPKSVLAQILFEPEAVLEDSLTYDITSWALPYAHGVEAYALDRVIRPEREFEAAAFRQNEVQPGTLAYISPWRASVHPRFLAALLDKKVRVRYASYPFELDGKKHPAGALSSTEMEMIKSQASTRWS
ncbi:peptidase M14 carboxypeptidase A [Nitritalea halalkaliphila LW7]|uniref:Peptidase M14 carboxypeptidase A n=1 Tax=Nitritalea halalkaliphila LW7 TaxID=1189621 RepID=I5BWC3_9BACT|nr:M14 family zinc carboxypeptidase [Nitritalea halalkaliphila]EIM73875.1 peptidase M14 carboxypeptidase A [Nitritalea halalkaliphila LW7]